MTEDNRQSKRHCSVASFRDQYSSENRFATIEPRQTRYSSIGHPQRSANRELLGDRIKLEHRETPAAPAPLRAPNLPPKPAYGQSGSVDSDKRRSQSYRPSWGSQRAPVDRRPIEPSIDQDRRVADISISALCKWQGDLDHQLAQDCIKELAQQASSVIKFSLPSHGAGRGEWSRLEDFRQRLRNGNAMPEAVSRLEHCTEKNAKLIMAESLAATITSSAELTTFLAAVSNGLAKHQLSLPVGTDGGGSVEVVPSTPQSLVDHLIAQNNDIDCMVVDSLSRSTPDDERASHLGEPATREGFDAVPKSKKRSTKLRKRPIKGIVQHYCRELGGYGADNTRDGASLIERFPKAQDLFLWHANFGHAAISAGGMDQTEFPRYVWRGYEKQSSTLWKQLDKDQRTSWTKLRARAKEGDLAPFDIDVGARLLRDQGLIDSELCSTQMPEDLSFVSRSATAPAATKPGVLPKPQRKKRPRTSSGTATVYDMDEDTS